APLPEVPLPEAPLPEAPLPVPAPAPWPPEDRPPPERPPLPSPSSPSSGAPAAAPVPSGSLEEPHPTSCPPATNTPTQKSCRVARITLIQLTSERARITRPADWSSGQSNSPPWFTFLETGVSPERPKRESLSLRWGAEERSGKNAYRGVVSTRAPFD